jgi:hypothetical protein
MLWTTSSRPSIGDVTVAQTPDHGRVYKLAVAPFVATGRFVCHVCSGLVRVDASWREQRKTAPFPLFRWTAGIGILIWTAAGSAPLSISGWFTAHLPWLIVAGVLMFAPDVARIEFGGMKMDLLRETRSELRELASQVYQMQIQQAAASSNATAGINQTFHGIAAVSEVTAATKQGEETKAVPLQAANLQDLIARAIHTRTFDPPWGSASSTEPQQGSTVEE